MEVLPAQRRVAALRLLMDIGYPLSRISTGNFIKIYEHGQCLEIFSKLAYN